MPPTATAVNAGVQAYRLIERNESGGTSGNRFSGLVVAHAHGTGRDRQVVRGEGIGNACGAMRLLTNPHYRAKRVMGGLGMSPGKGQVLGRTTFQYARSASSNRGDSMTYRSWWPFP